VSWPVFEGCLARFGGSGWFLRDVAHGLGVPWAGEVRQHGRPMVLRTVLGVCGIKGNQTREHKVEDLWVCG
jgi:hypothetical protein